MRALRAEREGYELTISHVDSKRRTTAARWSEEALCLGSEKNWKRYRRTSRLRQSSPTERNKYEMRCGVCDGLFYINEAIYQQVRSAMEFDPTDNPFRCNDCEQEYDEEAVY